MSSSQSCTGGTTPAEFIWPISNFSTLTQTKEEKKYSAVFSTGVHRWRVQIYLKVIDDQKPELDVYLLVTNSSKLPKDSSIDAKFELSVVDQVDSHYNIDKEVQHRFEEGNYNGGFSLLVPIADLYDVNRGYLLDDILTVKARVYLTDVPAIDELYVETQVFAGGDVNKVRLKKEQEDKEGKIKVSDCYTYIQVATNKDLLKPIPREMYFELLDHDKVRGFYVHNLISFSSFKKQVADEFNVPVECQCFWLWEKRKNRIYRPYRPLTPEEETQPVGQLRKLSPENNSAGLKLFLDVKFGPDLHIQQPQKTRDDILLFFKLYDPIKEELSYVGRIIVKSRSYFSEISAKLNKMAGFPLSQQVAVYKDVKFDPTFICQTFYKTLSFGRNKIVDGDVLYVQKSPPYGDGQHLIYPDVPLFLAFLHNRKVVHFRSLEKPKDDDFALELSKLDSYNVVLERVGCVLGINDPTRIRFTPQNLYSHQPTPIPIDAMRKCNLSDMLVENSDILYYQVLKPESASSSSETHPSAPSSSCVMCLDAPSEGACVPCGHMCGCMRCLNEIRGKNMGCPVCRAKIQLIVRIYTP